MAEKKAAEPKPEEQNASPVPERTKQSISEREEAVLGMWKEREIFQKSLAATDGAEPYVFYDGPPFATGLPHYGHLLPGTLKDVMPRYQTMRGRYVRRQWGWDCHGLPIENLIEKELGFKQKRDIEAYGIEKFNQKAADSVLMYDKEWKELMPRMGRFVDMEISYKTMDASYTESIWWAFKTLYEKKSGNDRLIYEGYKSMHICPRCETTLAISEVGMNYKDTKDISVYVKFALVDEPETSLLAWTTTPWTLPGNVALAVGADMEYLKVQVLPVSLAKGESEAPQKAGTIEYLYIAKSILESKGKPNGDLIEFAGHAVRVVDSVHGKELIGKRYTPVFDAYASDEKLENRANGWQVYAADFVTTESGTGIVHIAPAFGEDDMILGKEKKLPFVQHVAMDGTIDARVVALAGLQAKPAADPTATDVAVIKQLAAAGVLFAKEKIEHSYPFCWRCDTPLLNYAASSWFVNVTALKPKLLEANREVAWIPTAMRDGRFGKWLEGARDWAISRSRYWGAPIPVWRCNTCGNVEAIGTLAELKQKTRSTNSYFIMRHGEAANNVTGTVSYLPDDPYPLTELGRAQADKAAATLKDKKIDLIIASPVLRTRETAERVRAILGLPESAVVIDPRLSEVNTGDFNGRPIEEYRSYFGTTFEKFAHATPGGETLHEMKSRLSNALYEIDAAYQGKRIVFVTHEYAVWLMEAAARGATDEEAAWMKVEGGDDYIANAEVRELDFAPIPIDRKHELNFHRPYIDTIRWHCTCELGTMQRVPDVFDCWFESGSMPFAQFHYLGDRETPEGRAFFENFPADFIAEGLDQTRGWFYTLMVLSVGLFDRAPYKSVIVNGMILAEDGQKMSKKLKNYPDLMGIVRKYGADALRYYLIASPAVRADDLRFSEAGVEEVFKKLTLRIDNTRSFYEMYAGTHEIGHSAPESSHVLDRWIRSRFFEALDEVTRGLDQHEVDRAVRPIMGFIDDVSTWYIRRSRDRFKETESGSDDGRHAAETTGWLLLSIAKLIAPVMPFLADDLYGRLQVKHKKESVHLELWPESGVIEEDLLAMMRDVRDTVTKALEARAKAGIKIRQPLARLSVGKTSFLGEAELTALLSDEINVHAIEGSETLPEGAVLLDTALTPKLREEGDVRETIRFIQELRKKTGLAPGESIVTIYKGDTSAVEFLGAHASEISRATSTIEFRLGDGDAKLDLGGGGVFISIARA